MTISDKKLTTENYRMSALTSLMNSQSRVAAALYRSYLAHNPEDTSALMELACAVIVDGGVDEASKILGQVKRNELTHSAKARFDTAQAYLLARKKQVSGFRELLEQAVASDPGFALAHLSLGRHWLWSERNLQQARIHLDEAERLAPNALGASLCNFAVEADAEIYTGALRLATQLARRSPKQVRLWLLVTTTALVATPWEGRLFVLLIAFGTFLPFVGPMLYLSWIVLAAASIAALRRISIRLAILPILYFFAISLTYLARYIVIGKLFP